MNKLDLQTILIDELKSMPAPSYAQKRMYGEIQKKINEIIDWINKQPKEKEKYSGKEV